MPITTQRAKSGEKRLFKRQASNLARPLNRVALSLSREGAGELTPGAVTERLDRRHIRNTKKKQTAIVGNRRRRKKGHV